MEFQFNVNQYFKRPIVEIGNTLLPPEFAGDRRALWNTVNKVAEVVNEMGEASAHAQGLNKPITTAERLRQSDQNLYLLIDSEANNGNGAVTGMLKIGRKGLYVFDREGQHYQVTPPCVLDFYVHEKRQRSGLGKKLFEYMLERENVKPHNLAIDRPSEKFLNFLNKHYNLTSPIKQMNNYVVYDGFFPESQNKENPESSPLNRTNGLQSTLSPNTQPLYGRYGAPRPPCSMGQIIHNTTAQKNSEPTSPENNFNIPQDVTRYNQPQQINIVQSSPNYEQHNVLRQNEKFYLNRAAQEAASNSLQHNDSQQNAFRNPQELDAFQKQSHALQNQPSFVPNQIRMFPEKENGSQNNQTIAGIWPGQSQPQQVYQMSQLLPKTPSEQGNLSRYPPFISNEHYSQQMNNGSQQMNSGGQNHDSNSPYIQPNSMPPNHQIDNKMDQPVNPQNYRFSELKPPLQKPHYPEPIADTRTPYYPNQEMQQNGVPPESQFLQQSNQMENNLTRNETLMSNQHYPQSNPVTFSQNIQSHPPVSNNEVVMNNSFTNQYPQTTVINPSSFQTPNQHIYNQYPQYINNQQIHPSNYISNVPTTEVDNLIPYKQVNGHSQVQIKKDVPPKAVVQPQKIQEEEHQNNHESQPETVQSLLQVDPKYFKPDPIQLRQPSYNIQNNPNTRTRQRDTVASLMNAEQEFFDNGVLREEYRVPARPVDSESYPDVGYSSQFLQEDTRQHISQSKSTPQTLAELPNRNIAAPHPLQQMQYQMRSHPRQMQNVDLQEASRNERMYQQQSQPVHVRSEERVLSHRSKSDTMNQNQLNQQLDREVHPSPPQPQTFDVNVKNPPMPMMSVNQYYPQNHTFSPPYIPIEQLKQPQTMPSIEQNPIEKKELEERKVFHQNRNEPQHVALPQNMDREPKEPTGIVENSPKGPSEQAAVEIDKPKDISSFEVNRDSQPDTIRQSSYIPNEFTMHPEGQRVSPNPTVKTSVEEMVARKKEISRQYGLNDVDMRRKGYKSAIIKRPTDIQELDTLEYGYPPQVSKTVTKLPQVTDSVHSSPKLERPKSLEIQTENPIQEAHLPQVEMPSVEENEEMQINNELELENLAIKDELPENNEQESGKKTPRHLTDQGYFDLKFYHNKLW